MSSSTLNDEAVCEQCGNPVVSSGQAAGCLHCLLESGIESRGRAEWPNHERHTYQHYEILRRGDGSLWELGRNAISVTYKARDMNLDMVVALKVLNSDLSRQPEARASFLRQAQAMAQIRHPHVTNVLQFRQVTEPRATSIDSGECFYAMEFVEGETLESRVVRVGPLSSQMAIKVGLDVASALAVAEKLGVLQYNMTPSHIMLDRWVETNFARSGAEFETQLSARIINLGLPDSKQITSHRANQIESNRRGIYSFGLILLFSLIGPSANVIASRRKLPLRQLKAQKVPTALIAMLKTIFSVDRKSHGIGAAECTRTLQVCFSQITGMQVKKKQAQIQRTNDGSEFRAGRRIVFGLFRPTHASA